MQAYQCDRCGKFYSRRSKTLSETRIFITCSPAPNAYIKDLCDECQNALEAWWANKKKEVEDENNIDC